MPLWGSGPKDICFSFCCLNSVCFIHTKPIQVYYMYGLQLSCTRQCLKLISQIYTTQWNQKSERHDQWLHRRKQQFHSITDRACICSADHRLLGLLLPACIGGAVHGVIGGVIHELSSVLHHLQSTCCNGFQLYQQTRFCWDLLRWLMYFGLGAP